MSKKSGPVVDSNGNPIAELSESMQKSRNRAFEAIQKKALLVTLERSMFTNFVFDTSLNDKVCEHFKIADDSVIHVRKCLIHPRHMEKLMSITNDAIMLLWNLTRPWDNNDFRMLPMEMYDDFQQTFQKLKDDFEDVRQTFIDGWPEYVKEAKTSLGKAFNKDDYPDQKDLEDIFVLNIVTRELNDPDDLRLNLTEQELIDLEAEAGEKFVDAQTAMREQVLTTIREMSNVIATSKSTEFAKAAAPIASLINIINTDGDPALEQAMMEFKDMLAGNFDDLDVDDAVLSADERETKAFENMDEKDMMMVAEDADEEDDLDNW